MQMPIVNWRAGSNDNEFIAQYTTAPMLILRIKIGNKSSIC